MVVVSMEVAGQKCDFKKTFMFGRLQCGHDGAPDISTARDGISPSQVLAARSFRLQACRLWHVCIATNESPPCIFRRPKPV